MGGLEEKKLLNYIFVFCCIHLVIRLEEGSKKVWSCCPEQVDFPSVQVPFSLTCLMGKVSRKLSVN